MNFNNQPGFSSTDVQHVRQQNAQSAQGQFQPMGQSHQYGQYVGPQAGYSNGNARTDAEQVRQQNAQSAQHNQTFGNEQHYQTGYQQSGNQFGQFSGAQAGFQNGFAGTDAQQVRQQNAQSAQHIQGYGNGSQQPIANQQMGNQFGQFSGPQALFQSGFAGTNAEEVRQQNAQSAQHNQTYGNGQQQPMIGYRQMQTGNQMGQFSAPQQGFQSGFAGTDAQQVRQQNAQSAQHNQTYGNGTHHPITGYQQVGNQFGQSQAGFQTSFSNTDADHVRQQNFRSAQGNQFGTTSYNQ